MSLNKIIGYFDLVSEYRKGGPKAIAETTQLHWIPQYLALLAGIVAQKFFSRYMATGHWNLDGFAGWVIASAIIAIMAFPAVYKKSFDPEKPIFVQLCVIFVAGTGWQSLATTALKGAGVTPQ
jgi:hypothetical protein